MCNIEESYWSLLRAGLWNDKRCLADFKPLTAKEWGKVIWMGIASSAIGFVADGVGLLPKDCLPEVGIINRLLKKKMLLLKSHTMHNLAIRRLMALLDEVGVESVLLKGQSLAQYFERPESRNVGDIDVYTGERTDALVEKLMARGYACEEDIYDNVKHAVFHFDGIPIELHRTSLYLYTPKANRLYTRWWEDAVFSKKRLAYIDEKGEWHQQPAPGAQVVAVPETTLNVFYTFVHLFNHYMSFQFQMKQFLDMAAMLKREKDNIDVPLLQAKLAESGMLRPWQMVGCYLHKAFGLERDCIPFYNDEMEGKAEKFGRHIRERIFASKPIDGQRPKGRIASKLFTYYLNCVVAMQTLPLFPKLTAQALLGKTGRGLRCLFLKTN